MIARPIPLVFALDASFNHLCLLFCYLFGRQCQIVGIERVTAWLKLELWVEEA